VKRDPEESLSWGQVQDFSVERGPTRLFYGVTVLSKSRQIENGLSVAVRLNFGGGLRKGLLWDLAWSLQTAHLSAL